MNEQIEKAEDVTRRRPNMGMTVAIVGLMILTLTAIGFAAYVWTQNHQQQTALSDKDAQIQKLDGQIKGLNSQVASMQAKPIDNDLTQAGTVIPIRELGVSITVPDSIKDLTYSYTSHSNENGLFRWVDFSTKTITDHYASTKECTSYGIAPPLGGLERYEGVYDHKNLHLQWVRQFNGFYIAYSSPQATCANDTKPGPVDSTLRIPLIDLQRSLDTMKEL